MDPRAMRLGSLVLLAAATRGPPTRSQSGPVPAADEWPEADALFRGAERWHGGDGAYSVDLGDERVLWLFGDSFVEADAPGHRRGSRMVRNSIAVQEGYDPSRARVAFHHGGNRETPTDFFPCPTEGHWFWPGPGVRVGERLLLPFLELQSSDEGLGFEAVRSVLQVVDKPNAPPVTWQPREVKLPDHDLGVQLGFGAWRVAEDHLLAFSPVEPGPHDVYLARWSLVDVRAEHLEAIEWWGAAGWSRDTSHARPVVRSVQSEFSVHRQDSSTWWMIAVDGFGRTNIAAWTAPAPEGPWTALGPQVRPAICNQEDAQLLVYSAKAHPELHGDGVIITYCTNHLDFWKMAGDMSLYFPRFTRLRALRPR